MICTAYELVRRAFFIFSFFQNWLSCAYHLSKWLRWTCYVQYVPNRSQRTSNWLKISWRTSSYAVHIFTFFIFFVKRLSCAYQLSRLSKWTCWTGPASSVMSKMYQTEAKEPQIDWKYTGVRARTPCIFFTFFILVKNDFPVPINCLYCQSGLIMSKMCQTDAKEPWNILAYELVRRALLTRAILAFFPLPLPLFRATCTYFLAVKYKCIYCIF